MFAPVMKFWQTETPLHVVKVSRNARDELNLYRHEIRTQSECDDLWVINFPGEPYEAWLDRLAESWDEELDHMNYGLGYHVPGDCGRCDDHVQQAVKARNEQLFSVGEVWIDPVFTQDWIDSTSDESNRFIEDYID